MPEPTLAQGMILIGFGAAIGSMTTYVAALTQSRFQRKHLLLDKKVGALLELSRSIVNGAEVLHHIELFKQQLESATDDAGRSRATERLMDLTNSSNRWQAEISAQTTLVQALFGDPEPVIPPSPDTRTPDVPIPSDDEDFRATVKAMLDKCEHNIYEAMRSLEIQIALRARQLQ
jgi:hypothetical protein